MKQFLQGTKRQIIIPGDYEVTLQYAVQDWIKTAQEAILRQGFFAVALSGGSTPKAIYKALATKRDLLDWSKVLLFWSDERACSKTDARSNYRMAMEQLGSLPLLSQNILPMDGVGDLEVNAKSYERYIAEKIPSLRFDLMMLGMGDDGHTASLFPKTHGLHAPGRNIIANFIPDKDEWRLTVTFDAINRARKTVVYILGQDKAEMVKKIFSEKRDADLFPIQNVGSEEHPAVFILDQAAASAFSEHPA